MTTNERIGLLLKEYREKNKLSLNDVSKQIGKSRYTIFGYEKGENNITAETLMKICKVYGITITDIYNRIEEYL